MDELEWDLTPVRWLAPGEDAGHWDLYELLLTKDEIHRYEEGNLISMQEFEALKGPLVDGDEMCDECPYCLNECGDELGDPVPADTLTS